MAITTKCDKCDNKDLDVRISLEGIIVVCHICGKATKIGRAEDYDERS